MLTTRDMVHIALFAAIMAALGLLPPIPIGFIPVPITAQSMGVMLAGAILGARRGFLAIVLFLALVAVGLPLLAGGRGGFGVFFGPTAGFMVGWAVGAFVVGYLTERNWRRLSFLRLLAACVTGGILVVYGIGIPWLSVVANLPLPKATAGSIVFIPGDLIKAVLATTVAMTVKRTYPVIRT
jgi:biotin transport system substrate-specific component